MLHSGAPSVPSGSLSRYITIVLSRLLQPEYLFKDVGKRGGYPQTGASNVRLETEARSANGECTRDLIKERRPIDAPRRADDDVPNAVYNGTTLGLREQQLPKRT